MALESPSTLASELASLPAMSWKRFARDLHDGRIEQIWILSDVERMEREAEALMQLVTEGADALSAKSKKESFDEQSWDSVKSSPLCEVLREYTDLLPGDIPAELPLEKGVQHEIDLVPGTQYCVTRQWSLPREEVTAIDDFFDSRRKAGQVRESNSPHSTPTFCVKKAQGGWRIVHAYNKLNDATIPAQTPIPRKDVIVGSMALSTIFSALDPRDGLYQILMRGSDIPLTAKGAAWDWTVECQQAFKAVKQVLTEATILAVASLDRPFLVVCDVSDFAIGCALMQHDHEGRDRVVYYQSRQLKPAERNYPVYDKELLAMKWLLFFAEYNFQVDYKPGRLNVVADALSRRPDYAVHKTEANAIGVVRTSTPSSALLDDGRSAYANHAGAKQLLDYFATHSDKSRQKLAKLLRARVHRYRVHNGLLLYSAVDDNADRVVVPDDHELKFRITYEYHNAPTSGHPGREKTYLLLTRDIHWGHRYKWTARLGVDMIFRHHGMPIDIVSDRDPRFTAPFWQEVFTLRATQLSMPTADHPQTDGQTERVNGVLGDTLKSYAHSLHQWSDCLPMAEFAINNSVHVSTGHAPVYVNAMRRPRVPSMLGAVAPSLSGRGYPFCQNRINTLI
ncbi:unnamed protein product [Phytophthora fragariaefolia]|uniref:Unnamed protein product n=1 Tax=Phytophthora fragariaefolia TaxID=1490495 RepID=A0A9W6TJE3_9STRA|nr:unnamed protein product [Phytophthora fragariaefolia]